MRFFCDLTGIARPALAIGIGLSGSLLFLFDCGGSTFSSTSASGAGGAIQGGTGGAAALGGASGASAGQVGRGGTSSAGTSATAGTSSGGSHVGGASAGGSPPMAGAGGVVIVAGAGGMSTGGMGGAPTSVCPSNPPNGGACVSGLSCTYGSDLRAPCRTDYTCASGLWVASANTCSPLVDCGSRDGGVPQVGHACAQVGDDCTLNGGSTGLIYCRCDQHLDTSPISTQWDCLGPPAKPCPQLLPNEGQPCDGSATDICSYGSCTMGPAYVAGMQCINKVWTKVAGGCTAI